MDFCISKTPKKSNPSPTIAITNAIKAIRIAIVTPLTCYEACFLFLFFHV